MKYLLVIFIIILNILGIITLIMNIIEYYNSLSKLNIPIYYINMDKHVDRNMFMLEQFRHRGITNFTRISGVDVSKQNKYKINVKSKYKKINNGEIGCTLAHLNAIEQFLKDGHDYALICEDDANFELQEYWKYSLRSIAKLLSIKDPEWTSCHLYHNYKSKSSNNKFKFKSIVESDEVYGTVAYLISKRNALQLKELTNNFTILQNPENVDPRADYFIYYRENTKPYILIPAIINLNTETISSIHNKDDEHNFKHSEYIKKQFIK